MDRREALKWVATALAALPEMEWKSLGAEELKRTLTDLDLLHRGKLWDRTLTKAELRTVAAVCDVIIPADEKSRGASEVGVPDFIDEWVSAPYPLQQENKTQIREGLAWLDTEGKKRFEKEYADLTDEQKQRICDDICFAPNATPEFEEPAPFFPLFRNLTA